MKKLLVNTPFLLFPLFVMLLSATQAHSSHAVITIYHHVSEHTPPSTSLSPAQFREQMEYLRDNEFNVWPLDKVIANLQKGRPLPDRTVAITFDDGYESIFEEGFPILQEMGFPFALFVSTQPIDRRQHGYMSWEQIRTLSEAGVLIGNHMVSHPHMIDAQPGEDTEQRLQRLRDELLTAEQRIKQETGQSHRILAYPYGEYDMPILEMLEKLGFTGLAQNSGAIGHNSDFRALPRFPLAGIFAGMNTVPTKLETLAFHVLYQEPRSPLTSELRPAVTLQLAGDFHPAQLACYSGSETMQIEWLDREEGIFRIQPENEVHGRRWGYNCTAPKRGTGRYYWFNKFWTRSTPENQD